MLVKVAGVLTHSDSIHTSFTWRRLLSYSRHGVLVHGEVSSVLAYECKCPAVTSVTRVCVSHLWRGCPGRLLFLAMNYFIFLAHCVGGIFFGLTKMTDPTSLGLA